MASDGCLYRVLRESTRLGFTVRVHCENGGVVDALVDEKLAQRKRAPADFVRSRPPAVEEEAVARTLAIARLAGAPVYITHMSTAGGIVLVRAARDHGQTVHAEVCLHHLLLDARLYDGKRAQQYLVVPPLHRRRATQAPCSPIPARTFTPIAPHH